MLAACRRDQAQPDAVYGALPRSGAAVARIPRWPLYPGSRYPFRYANHDGLSGGETDRRRRAADEAVSEMGWQAAHH